MSEKEKEICTRLAEAYNALPEKEQVRLIGFVEGVAAMSAARTESAENETD